MKKIHTHVASSQLNHGQQMSDKANPYGRDQRMIAIMEVEVHYVYHDQAVEKLVVPHPL